MSQYDRKAFYYVFHNDEEKKSLLKASYGLLLVYVAEIVDLNVRCHALETICTSNSESWLIAGWVQVTCNFIGCCAVVYYIGASVPISSLLMWLFIVVLNFAQQLSPPQSLQPRGACQFLINFFGYFTMIRYWSAIDPEQVLSFSKGFWIKLLGVLHIGFTASVIACMTIKAYQCSSGSHAAASLDAIETMVEMLLLGYLAAYANLDDHLSQLPYSVMSWLKHNDDETEEPDKIPKSEP